MHLRDWLKKPLILSLFLAILFLAIFTRFYALDTAPAGGDGDTAWIAIDAMDWLDRGAWPYYVDAMHAPAPLMVIFDGLAVLLYGVSIETTRLVTAVASIFIVLLLVPTAWLLLADDESSERRLFAGLGAMAAAATSLHAMNVARLGVNSPVLPFLTLLSLWSAAAAWQKGGWWRWVLAGICLALTQYIYIAAHMMGLVAVLWFLHAAIVTQSLFKERWRGWFIMAAVTLLVYLPNLILYITWPESFTQRLDSSSAAQTGGFIWNYDLSAYGGVIGFLLKKVWASFLALGISWDSTYLVGTPAVLTPVFFAAWLLGLILALWRFRRTAYAWVLLSIPALLLADLITSTTASPHPMRQIGLLPFHYLLAGYGLAEVALYLLRLAKPLRLVAFTILGLAAFVPTIYGFYHYIMVDIPASYADERTSWRISQTDLDISARINAHPDESYLLPYGEYTRQNIAWLTMESFRDRHSALNLDGELIIPDSPSEIVVVMPTDPNRARHDLAVDLDSSRWWVLLHQGQALLLPPLNSAQADELLAIVENTTGESLIDASGLLVANFYKIATPANLFQSPEFQPADANFALAGSDETELRLLGYSSYPTEPIAGEPLEVSLYWQTLVPLSRNYEITVQLWDDFSQSYGNSHILPYQATYRTRIWQTDEITVTHHILFLSETMPLGRYALSVRVLRLLENSPLATTGSTILPTMDGAWLRDFRLSPDLELRDLPELAETIQIGENFALSHLSLQLDSEIVESFGIWEIQQAQELLLELQWDVLARPSSDYSYFIHLIPIGEINPVAQADGALGASFGLPSGAWRLGDTWQESIRLSLPENLPLGEYELWLGVYNSADGTRLAISLNGTLQADNRLNLGRLVVIE